MTAARTPSLPRLLTTLALLLGLVGAGLVLSANPASAADAITLTSTRTFWENGRDSTFTMTLNNSQASYGVTGDDLVIRDDTAGNAFARCPADYDTQCSFFYGPPIDDGPHVFRAYLADPGTGNAIVNPKAVSAPLSIAWRPFTITLARQVTKDGKQLIANVDGNGFDSGLSILIYDTTTGAIDTSCGLGSRSCTSYPTGSLPDTYEAFLAPYDQYNPPASFPPPGAVANSDNGPLVPFGPTPANSKGGPTGICQKCNQAHSPDPVNTATGVFWDDPTDLAVPGRGPTFAWQRDYSTAMSTTSGPLGYGWTFNYAMTTRTTAGAVTVVQENGSEVTFQPDGLGGYTAPTNVLATLTLVTGGGLEFTRTTDHLIFDFAGGGSLLTVKDRNGETTTLGYTAGVLTSVTDPAGRAATITWTGGKITAVTDTAGRTVTYAYDTAGNLQTVTDLSGKTTGYTYDTSHRLLTKTDPRGGVTTNAYGADGRIASQTDAALKTTTFAYSTSGDLDLTDMTDPRGTTTRYYYWAGALVARDDAYGTPSVATTTYVYDARTGAATVVTDPNGNVTTHTYDSLGRELTRGDALNAVSALTYTSAGDLASTTDPNGSTTTYVRDTRGNVTSVSRPLTDTVSMTTAYAHATTAHPGDVTTVTDPRGKTTSFTRDSAGDITATTDPLGRVTTVAYDTAGRVTSTVSPRGNVTGGTPATYRTSFTTDAFGRVLSATDPKAHATTTAYDDNGNPVTVTDPAGKSATTVYDAVNRPTQTTRPDTTVVKTGYDANGNVTSQTDGLNRVTTYTLDPLNRVTAVTDPAGRHTDYAYDTGGRLTQRTDATGKATRYSYDADGRRTGIDYNAVTATGTPNVSYAYDAAGRRTSMADGQGTTNYGYDALDRLVSQTGGAGGDRAWEYDLAGHVTKVTYPNTQWVSRTYDDAGQWTGLTDWTSQAFTFTYDPDGNPTGRTNPNATSTTTAYDAAGLPTQVTHKAGTTTFASYAYSYDAKNQVTQSTPTGTGTPARALGYTDNGRVAAVNTTTAYAWDAADNLIGTPAGETLTYDTANQLASKAKAGTTTLNYVYSANGSRTQEKSGTTVTKTLAYNSDQRLKSQVTGGVTTTYGYDGDGTRATKKVGGGAVQSFTWDTSGSLPMLLQDATNMYLWGPGGQLVEQKNLSTSVATYAHEDALGTVHALTSQTGTVVGTVAYDTHGKRTGSTGTVTSPFGFAGEYLDNESGLVYLRARYYDANTDQFLTRDPLTASTRDPYGYAGGTPAGATDPTGLVSLAACGGAAGGFLLGVFGQVCPLVVAVDDRNGDITIGGTFTKGGGLQTPTLGFSAVAQASDARTVAQMGGPFAYGGASGGVAAEITGGVFGGDACGAPGNQVYGAELGVSARLPLPLPGEVHGGGSTTATATYATISPRTILKNVYQSWLALGTWH